MLLFDKLYSTKYKSLSRGTNRKVTDPISQANLEILWKLNPETAATVHELFRKMNESEDFKKEMLKGTMALQHGTSSRICKTAFRFHTILSANQRSLSSCYKSVNSIEQYMPRSIERIS